MKENNKSVNACVCKKRRKRVKRDGDMEREGENKVYFESRDTCLCGQFILSSKS